MDIDFVKLLNDFIKIIEICKLPSERSDYQLEILQCPHTPHNLPNGKMAIYIFIDSESEEVLKVGRAGPKSNARFLSQPYHPSSSASNLSNSLLNDEGYWKNKNYSKPSEDNIGEWIKANPNRVNIMVSEILGKNILSLLEIYFQCRLNTRYEGKQ